MATFSDGDTEIRVVDGRVSVRENGARAWLPVSKRYLLRFAVDSPAWDWLREQGLRRPSPSGKTKEEDRSTVQQKLRLNREVWNVLNRLAGETGMTKSQLVSEWAEQAMRNK